MIELIVRYFYTTMKTIEGDRVFWWEVPQLRRLIDAIAGSVANDRRYLILQVNNGLFVPLAPIKSADPL
ncbi:hypothetical protein MiTs_00559 [Microcystis aeruginosa NIES-2521]|uniref:Uncharacterized protein n=2 Tax=Microcystis aeruginosa TaxID=1126 RepID=A0A5A5RZV6_MICAE|nr:hypothetical protein MiTs_00559 [Microcystis aeruginosa NIES-2521]